MVVRIRSSANPTWYQVTPHALGSPELRRRMRRLAFAGWARTHGLQQVVITADDDESGDRIELVIDLDTELTETYATSSTSPCRSSGG